MDTRLALTPQLESFPSLANLVEPGILPPSVGRCAKLPLSPVTDPLRLAKKDLSLRTQCPRELQTVVT